MKETLHIKNFGPIKEVNLALGKVNVLIGDQGTGKSTVSKVYAFLHDLLGHNEYLTNTLKPNISSVYKKYQLEEYFNSESYILFTLEKVFKIEYVNNKFDIEISRDFFYKNGDTKIERFEKAVYIPAERSMLSRIDTAVLYKLNENQVLLAPYISSFASKFHSVKKELNRNGSFNKKLKGILNIEYYFENEQDLIQLPNGKRIKLDDASSAIQTNLSLLAFLDQATGGNTIYPNKYYIIEELELSLFPKKIREIVNFIVSRTNNWNDCNSNDLKGVFHLLFNTHSPYILTSLNNLMYAYSVGQRHRDQVSEIIPEKYWLNPEDVSAYMLVYDEKEGGCIAKNIIDDETKLIDSIQIDGVSDILSDEFNKIMEIELQG